MNCYTCDEALSPWEAHEEEKTCERCGTKHVPQLPISGTEHDREMLIITLDYGSTSATGPGGFA